MDKIKQLSTRVSRYQKQARPVKKMGVDKIASTLVKMDDEELQEVERLAGKRLYPELKIRIKVEDRTPEELKRMEEERNREVISHFKKYNIKI